MLHKHFGVGSLVVVVAGLGQACSSSPRQFGNVGGQSGSAGTSGNASSEGHAGSGGMKAGTGGMSTADMTDTAPGGGGAADASPGGAGSVDGTGKLGTPCGEAGAITCNAPASKLSLLCQGGQWTEHDTCSASQNCDQT